MNKTDFENTAERFCDGYCKFPYICRREEELEAKCENCPLTELEALTDE